MTKHGEDWAEEHESASNGPVPLENEASEMGRKRRPRFLPLKSDLIFKMIFGDYRYIQIIRAFLIVALDIPAEEYESLEIIDPHLERDSPDDKL
ncbi:MAG: hypothetical protein LBU13_08380, partial [Synergistaceae bacterium]|nr:hypothetical protein [Synergistaceae bacterium]